MKLLTFKRLAVYLLTFFVALSIAFALTDFWKQWDISIYQKLYVNADAVGNNLSDKIAVVNIEKPDLDSKDASLEAFRKRIISFLNTVANHYENSNEDPKAILLDISFSKDSTELQELKNAIEQLKSKKIKVYAVYSLKDYFENLPIYEANDAGQATVLYDSVFSGGRLHSGFKTENGLISYPSDIFLKGAFTDSVKIESIVKRVALDEHSTKIQTEYEELVTPLGPIEAMQSQTYQFASSEDNSSGKFEPSLDLDDKYILVGDLKHDYQKDIETPRTYFMAWALNEKIIDEKMAKQPLGNIAIIIGQTLFFSLFTVLVFALLFKYVKRLQTKPKALTVFSFVVALLFFVIYGAMIFAFDKIIPIGLTLLGMLIAALLSYHFAYKFLVTGVAEGGGVYDVFISYSHGNSDWVKKNVYEPLKAHRKPNGEPLAIFFDEKSIGVGEAFTSKYMWGIVDSKVFIPIVSEEYYKKNHCKNEMDLAYKRNVEKLINILPVAFSYDCIPAIYQHVIFILRKENTIDDPSIAEKLKEDLGKLT